MAEIKEGGRTVVLERPQVIPLKAEIGQYVTVPLGHPVALDGSKIVGIDHYNNKEKHHSWISYSLDAPERDGKSERWWITVSSDMGHKYDNDGVYIWRAVDTKGAEMSEAHYRELSKTTGLETVELMTGKPVCRPEGISMQSAASECTLNVFRMPETGNLISDEIFVEPGVESVKLFFMAVPAGGKILMSNSSPLEDPMAIIAYPK